MSFTTQDKGSGIERYEIQERRKPTIDNRSWIVAESPYVLNDQVLHSFIDIRAVDKAGNVRVATVPPKYPLAWYQNYKILGIILGVLSMLIVAWRRIIVWRQRNK